MDLEKESIKWNAELPFVGGGDQVLCQRGRCSSGSKRKIALIKKEKEKEKEKKDVRTGD